MLPRGHGPELRSVIASVSGVSHLGVKEMKGLARRVKSGFSIGVAAGAMIAMTCSMALGQSTPDEPVGLPEPSSFLMLANGLALMIFIGWLYRKRARDSTH
jgi:zinc transporter ZupT